jgi:hypothetical protein
MGRMRESGAEGRQQWTSRSRLWFLILKSLGCRNVYSPVYAVGAVREPFNY